MTFQSPLFFLLLIVIALSIFIYFRKWGKTQATLQWSLISWVKTVPAPWRVKLKHTPVILKTVSLVLIVFALARPQQANTQVKKNVEGIDIVIALDVSDSMLIEDMEPVNRLESAKETIKNFVTKRGSDRIGMVVFAGEAFTLVPPTLDYQLILDRASEITTAAQANIKDGTALGVALAAAAGRLKDSQAKSRVIIFLTDGENNSGTIDPETGLEIAKGYGLKIYSIGIGKDGPTRIPVYTRDAFGQRVKTYQPFESHVNEDLLGRMASETGGRFFRATRDNSLEKVFSDIDQMEKTKIDVNKYVRFDELFEAYLKLAFVLYLIAFVLEQTFFRRVV